MKKLLLSLVLLAVGSTFAQTTASQDMKDAGHDTAQATKKTGRKIKRGTKRATHKAARKTRHGAEKVEDKTAHLRIPHTKDEERCRPMACTSFCLS